MTGILEHCAAAGDAWVAIPRPAAGGWIRASIVDTEEKGSDVNLATYLMFDGMRNKYDAAMVVSGDSDLVEPIRLCNGAHIRKPVGVVNPYAFRFSKELNDVAAWYAPLDPSILATCQLPRTVTARNGVRLTRPTNWR